MIINHKREKLLNAIIYFLKNTKYCGKTKLFKLLFYLDFTHFKETGRAVTGLDYFTWQYGPAPESLFEEMKKPHDDFKAAINILSKDFESFQAMQARRPFDKKFFTKRELRILEQVSYIFKEALAKDMVESSHLPNEPWDTTKRTKGMSKPIDYMLALDGSADSLSREEVEERLHDRKEIERIFS